MTTTCSECGGVVSAAAAVCPHCGFPRPGSAPSRRSNALVLALLGGGVLVLLLLVGVGFFLGRRDAAREARERRPEEIVDFEEVPAARGDVPAARAEPPDADTYELSAVDVQPELLDREQVAAELSRLYPPLLRDAGVTGRVTMRMRIRADGGVDAESIQVLDATHDAFVDPATMAARRMRFTPAQVGGRPVAVWASLPVDFRLES